MVIWSYLLLGIPVSASLERVLAPVDATPAAASPGTDDAVVPAKRDTAPAPLVSVGADEIDLLSEIERQLTEKLQPAGRLRLAPVSALPVLPHGQPLPVVEITDHPARLATTSILVRFRLRDGDRTSGPYAVSFRVQVLAQAWVSVRRLELGEPLTADDVAAREIDLIRDPKAVPADEAIFGRYELARSTAPERPLTWNDLNPRALVRKGQLVDVLASEGALSITMKGQATHSGALGEVVTIRNLESKREFPAEVVDENKVRVHF